MVMAAQPVWAAPATQVTGVKVNPTSGGVEVVLETRNGARPQVFTVSRGNSWVADVINTQLRLPQSESFRQDNPAPGISSVVVLPLDTNSVRVIVAGQGAAPAGQVAQRDRGGLLFSLTRPAGSETAQAAPAPTAQPGTATQSAPAPVPPAPAADVLVPNPKITVDGVPVPPQSPNVAPPFLPRAVAPPVGDISISNIDASATEIDLGSAERVPRLVLRDAPVREVLSLLSRAAGLNLAFTGESAGTGTGTQGQGQQGTAAAGAGGPTISLDIENEPVQNVFNYVLRLSGLEANRSGNTIFVGPRLPNEARDVTIRTFRLNQVSAEQASGFLVSMGAESAVTVTQPVTTVNAIPVQGAEGAPPITQTSTTNQTVVNTLRIDPQDSSPLLRGLQVLVDTRLNTITLVGARRLVDVASSQLVQLDLRRRQVAVNVKIVDVNLAGTDSYNSSFSFGINDSFFTNDNGAASLNFGGVNPPTRAQATGSPLSPPVVANPLSGQPFLDPNSSVPIPGTDPGTIIIDQRTGSVRRVQGRGAAGFFRPIPPVSTDPLQPGFSEITPATDNVVTIAADGTASVTQGTLGTAVAALPSLFRFPRRFLSLLQAQVTSGNAKILTDPTLVVQEGQTATVNLTQQVVGNVTQTTTTGDNPLITTTADIQEAGLILGVNVERIDDNGFVSLSVSPRVSAIGGTARVGQQEIALLAERSLSSGTIRLRDGQTLILSGIIQDQERTTVSKLPILGDLPIIGALFRSTNRQNQRAEVIVLLTPQIMDDSDRSAYGYNYTPSPDVRQILERGNRRN
ncbi:AMIN domain-containing protein [Trichocoleus sp. FACHB-46]|nr:AMIN domain-containing protein [Trichocoleus sp. FACHB-46]